jgi:hypothetical protein
VLDTGCGHRTLANWRTQHIVETGYTLIRILDCKELSAVACYPRVKSRRSSGAAF